MAVAQWPAGLPQRFEREGYVEGVGDGLRASATDTGPGKAFRKTSAMARPMAGAMLMTDSELATFEAFFRDDISSGALPFFFPAPRGGEHLLLRFKVGALPSWSPRGLDWWVTMTLEILP